MSAVYEGDDYKRVPHESPSRAEMQARIDREYANGELDVEEWRRGTDHLSACDSRGRVTIAVIGRHG